MIKIFKFLPKKIKLMAFFTAFFSLLQPFFAMLMPAITKQLIKSMDTNATFEHIDLVFFKIAVHSQKEALIGIIVASLIVAIITMLVFYFAVFFAFRITTYGAYYLRKKLFEHILEMSRSNLDNYSKGTLLTRFGNDIQKIADGFFIMCRGLVASPFFIVWGLTFSLMTDKYLSIALAIIIPLLVGGGVFVIIKLFPLYRKENWTLDVLNENAKEDINAIALIKSYNLENYRYKKYQEQNQKWYDVSYNAEKLSAFAWPIIDFVVLLGNIIIFTIVGALIKKNSKDDMSDLVANLYQFTTYMGMVANSVFNTTFNINRLFRSQISAKRYIEILDRKSEIPYLKNDIKIHSGKIEFKNVTFAYSHKDVESENKVLDNISFTINDGEKVGIIGPTGSGKTTLIKLLCREYILKDNNGQILVDNHDIKEIDTANLYDQISQVYQKPYIISGSVKKNITFAKPTVQNEEIDNAIKLSCADFINDYEEKYDYKINQRGLNISGGQRQRIAIAQALIKKPKILILDDATSALDNNTDLKIRQNITNNLTNSTLIVIAQRIKSIKEMDKIIVLNNGQVEAIGKHEDLLKHNKLYQEIYNSQEHGGEYA